MSTSYQVSLTAVLLSCCLWAGQAQAQEMSRDEIIGEAEKMAVAQFESMDWRFWGRFWPDGVCFAGVADLSKVSADPRIRETIKKLGDRTSSNGKQDGTRVDVGPWCLLHVEPEKEPHHADDMCIAQAFLDYYAETKDPKVLADTQLRVEAASDHILSQEMVDKGKRAQQLGWNEGLTWYWIDALFMAGPVHARLSELTGDPKYLNAMHAEWARVTDLLYDQEEHLYFRDTKYLNRKTKHGKKLFWARGNGWVMGALARVLPYIPKEDPRRPFYEKQLQEMSTKLASIQRPDGTWSPSLLDFENFPYSETSGTALNCFAMAWGINNGILDEKTFRPVVEKTWAALLAARNNRGFLGYVQGVGSEPAGVNADSFTYYGNGAFYMAAVQLAEMAPLNLPAAPTLTAAPPRK
jgi:unsaturated rhamnogalacturonyl hydrolase